MKKRALTLQEHQEILYELLYTLDDFCKDYDVKYFLAHGTLLGAIRHKGIIPWDDDADVMMERTEYERFLKLMVEHTPKGFEIYSIDNTPGYYYPFAKFGKSDTLLVEPFKYVPKKGLGINIDIFPIDGCPQDLDDAKKYVVEKRNRIWNELQRLFYVKRSDYKSLMPVLYYYTKYQIKKLPFFKKRYLKGVYSEAKEYSLESSTYFFSFWTFYGARNLHQVKSIDKIIYVPFGCRQLPVPIGYDIILQEEYGDYMTPPENTASTHQHGTVYQLV